MEITLRPHSEYWRGISQRHKRILASREYSFLSTSLLPKMLSKSVTSRQLKSCTVCANETIRQYCNLGVCRFVSPLLSQSKYRTTWRACVDFYKRTMLKKKRYTCSKNSELCRLRSEFKLSQLLPVPGYLDQMVSLCNSAARVTSLSEVPTHSDGFAMCRKCRYDRCLRIGLDKPTSIRSPTPAAVPSSSRSLLATFALQHA